MTDSKIILHWLNFSRSNRILWLLELLDIDYELKLYQRTKAFRAPKELYDIHPLGKSPVIEVVKSGKSEVIAETGRIIEYLVDNYDHQGKLKPLTDEGKGQVSYYLHYTEGTLQPYLTGSLVNSLAKDQAPFGFKTLVGAITGQLNNQYFGKELLTNLQYLEDIAAKNKGGYFVDDKLTAADVVLSFPIAEAIFASPERIQPLLKKSPDQAYPYLKKWSQLVFNDPSYKKTLEVVKAKL
ncbi:glutathione S-transferase 1 [[Candida] jaroonii]|uniref:Glutathione S-transferase 1 n=1 Tax=[Candida] jaroonii TaxID=467808 RepID=A0ACA9Y157_9ASCO|nr:glutathione S-transferase 1 [[Candida] jaroonii]